MTRLIHIIPVGGAEPIHDCAETCWCHPLLDPEAGMIHNAKDCREARERNGGEIKPDERWVLVGQP